MDIRGTVAFITGGAGGIGGGLAEALIERGARVVLADVDGDAAEEAAGSLGAGTSAVALDVTSRASWDAAAARVAAEVGPVDILCNNAGIAQERMPLEDMAEDAFARLVAINLIGVHHGIATFVPAMRARGHGHVVNTASALGLVPTATYSAYAATKAAVLALSEALHDELAPAGVGVSVLCPGQTRSRMSLRKFEGMEPARRAVLEADMMEPIWLGRAVAQAIENDALYVISHPDIRAAVAARFERTLAAFGAPAQPGFRVDR